MKLLADAGNTRLKLSWARTGAILRTDEVAAFDYAHLQAATDWVAALPVAVTQVCGVSVVGEPRRAQIEAALRLGILGQPCRAAQAAPPAVQWLTSTAQAGGVRNDYALPQQLGADRWAALLGVAAHERQRLAALASQALLPQSAAPVPALVPVLLASFGTATTLDALLPLADAAYPDCDYVFPGGLILPGVDLMRQALSQGTAQLPLASAAPCDPPPFPKHTDQAIACGIAAAQAGALWRQWMRLCKHVDQAHHHDDHNPPRLSPQLYVSGGAWAQLEAQVRQWFATTASIVYLPAPALDGLATLAALQ